MGSGPFSGLFEADLPWITFHVAGSASQLIIIILFTLDPPWNQFSLATIPYRVRFLPVGYLKSPSETDKENLARITSKSRHGSFHQMG